MISAHTSRVCLRELASIANMASVTTYKLTFKIRIHVQNYMLIKNDQYDALKSYYGKVLLSQT